MKYGRLSWILFAVTAALAGCVSEIEIQPKPFQREYVVSGLVTNWPEEHEVRVRVTHSMRDNAPEPAQVKAVALIENETDTIPFFELSPGVWRLLEFAAKPGNTYTLRIETPDKKVILSHPQMAPPPVPLGRVYFETSRDQVLSSYGIPILKNFISLYADFTLPSGDLKPYLRWRTDEAFVVTSVDQPWNPFNSPKVCYFYRVSESNFIPTFDGSRFSPGPVNRNRVVYIPIDWTFWERHTFTVRQLSITREAFEFWEKASRLMYQNGSLFDIQPGVLPGNLYLEGEPDRPVYGFFEAASMTLDRIDTYRHLLQPHFPSPLCNINTSNGYFGLPDRCYDCTLMEGASLTRPSFW